MGKETVFFYLRTCLSFIFRFVIEPSSVEETGSKKDSGPVNPLVLESTVSPLSSNFSSQLVEDDVSRNLSIHADISVSSQDEKLHFLLKKQNFSFYYENSPWLTSVLIYET